MLGTPSWKKPAVVTLAIITSLCLLAAVVLHLLGSAPAFYRQCDTLTPEDRTEESRQFVRQSTSVFNQIENESAWSGTFREVEVNAWLDGDFARKHGNLLPSGISQPRVSFDDGRVALAFQYQRGPVTAIVSASGRMWLPESNFVAIKLESVRAGVFPIPADSVMHAVSSAAKSAAMDLQWKQHEGKPVALLRLGRSDQSANVSVDHVEIKDGTLLLAGRSRGHGAASRADSTARDSESSGVSWNDQSPDGPRRK